GELGVVAARDALVAEVAADLEDAVIAADEHALAVEIERNAQHEIGVEGAVMRLERTGRRAAGDALKDGRLDFEELAVLQKTADMRDDARARHEALARLLVDDEVEVALTVNLLGITEAVPLFGQRAQGLGDEGERLDAHGDLAGLGLEERAGDADEVAEVELLFENEVAFLAEHVLAEVELDDALLVLDFDERAAALHAEGHEAAGDGHGDGVVLFIDVLRDDVLREVRRLDIGAERVEAGGAQLGELLAAHGMLVVGNVLGVVAHEAGQRGRRPRRGQMEIPSQRPPRA